MKNIKIHYLESKDYRMIPVTGAHGGISPNGEVIIDLYVERKEAPKSVDLEIDDTGKSKEIRRYNQRHIREKQIGLVIRPDIALIIGKFLIDKAKLVIDMKEE